MAVDPTHRRLVVIECKNSRHHSRQLDQHGWSAARQADEYAKAIGEGRAELYPFFSELIRSLARVYAADAGLESFELDPDARPTTAVWWPRHTPGWPDWDAEELSVSSDSVRVAKYRRHQSQFRQEALGLGPGARPGNPARLVGSTLTETDVATHRSLNFVDDAAYQHALRRSDEVQSEGGTLEVHRLFHNLLSSMPMCFNIFGSLGSVPGLGGVVRLLWDPEATDIIEVTCEVTPTTSLGDRTAFDAMIRYRTHHGSCRFIAIETKYTEPFSPTEYNSEIYGDVTERSGWFSADSATALASRATNQLWRGLMLASLAETETGEKGCYAVVATADDVAAASAARIVAAHLTDPTRLSIVTLEQLVEAARSTGDERSTAWASAFASRYLLR